MKTRLLLHRAALLGILVGVLIGCVACTVKPFSVTTTKGSIYRSLGGSIMTKAKTELASMTLPDGTTMFYSTTGKNEVSVPNSYIAGQVAEGLAGIAAEVSNVKTAADVSKTGIAADVTKTQIDATKAVDLLKNAQVE